MVLFCLVASHRSVDLNTVARLSTGALGVADDAVADGTLAGAVTLSTCNRLEIYGESHGEDAEAAKRAQALISERIAQRAGLDARFVQESMDAYQGMDVARHLFTVGSGLESAVVGEREITGQVRRALTQAQQHSTASGQLVKLFEAAARTAREVGSRTELGERGRSVVSVALDLANDVAHGTWADRHALVFGTGAYAGATMAALRDRGCADIEVYSASGRAEQFTDQRGGSPVNDAQLPAALRRADVVIGCSGGSAPMSAAAFPEGPRTVIDLALTRDFDPAIQDLPGVELITLESVRVAAPQETGTSVDAAREIIDQAAQAFQSAQNERSMDQAIVALRKHTLAVLDAELDKVRTQHGCTGAEQQVEFALRRMVRSLLHTPTVRARELARQGRGEDYISGLEALYGIEVSAKENSSTVQNPPANQSPSTAAQQRAVG